MEDYFELEMARIMFKKIFNEDATRYKFTTTRYLKLVNRYGMITGLIQKAIECADLHLKLQSEAAKCGVYIEDSKLVELIRSNI
ncbi:hypothetical protein [Paenibacillus xylanexedens]|uniref:hypothetical protein n=1 Tax=Paenibacillus xylanexedens TaxID=528191 RepID=UPI0011A83EEB|nr:hypothetical protein [Paenibacillus xylanexedens]